MNLICKIIVVFLIGLVLTPSLSAVDFGDLDQNINTNELIPDANFRTAIEKIMGVQPGENIALGDAIEKEGFLVVTDIDIKDLTGLEYFPNISSLYCNNNQIEELDLSNNLNIEKIYCANNTIQNIIIPENSKLKYLYCMNNNLVNLDLSNAKNLVVVNGRDNQLESINLNGLSNLERVYLYNNNLTQLDVTSNPDLNYLSCFNNNLSELNVDFNLELIYLSCSGNELNELNITNNTNLIHLYCRNNNLSELDVSKNPSLWRINCYRNLISELDVRNNPNLIYLYCYDNKIEELDLTNNTKLRYLYCSNNKINSLNVSNSPSLMNLLCGYNNLKELDVSQNPLLTLLSCHNNKLTELDTRSNPALTLFHCYKNNIENLDISKNKNLEYLYCYYNKLETLDPTHNPELIHLYCYWNELESLDVSKNTKLVRLWCGSNDLTALDLTQNSNLKSVRTHYNQMTVFPLLPLENNLIELLITYNLLECDDAPSILDAVDILGAGLTYLPQRDEHALDCNGPIISGVQDVNLTLDPDSEQTAVPLAITVMDDSGEVNVRTDFYYADGTVFSKPSLPDAIEYFPAGANLVKITATDLAGNKAEAQFQVIIAALEWQTEFPKDGWATIVFEDNQGDKDYNDFIVSMKAIETYNNINELTNITLKFIPLARGTNWESMFKLILDGVVDDSRNITTNTSAVFKGDAEIIVNLYDADQNLIDSTSYDKEQDLIIFDDTSQALPSTQKYGQTVNTDTKETYIEPAQTAEVIITIHEPSLNRYEDRSDPGIPPYRPVLNVKKNDIDVINVNRDDEMMNKQNYPLGIVIPKDWAWPLENKKIDDTYPFFEKYREWLGGDALLTDEAKYWYNFPSDDAEGDIFDLDLFE